MTRNEFFNILMDELKELPELDLQKIVSFYKNKISIEVSKGKNESEIIKDFGDPYLICKKYINSSSYSEIIEEDHKTLSSTNINKNLSNNDHIDELSQIKRTDYINPVNVESNDESNRKNKDQNRNYNFNNDQNANRYHTKSSPKVDKFLKLCIIILGIIVFCPILTSIAGIIIGILGVALSLLAGSIGILIGGTFTNLIGFPHIPQFITDFPYPAIVLFTIGSVCLSVFLICTFYYSCKFFFRLCKKLLDFLKSKGGIFNE
ncbi:DUF1700 domain-containing protein [Clostridium butyricum]|nr:DUF1700 domain-containing protein [Clostridium butyricum]